jgi:uncharacterized damage-inducible protein DinB
MKRTAAVLVSALLFSFAAFAQSSLPKGVFEGYDPEWGHVTDQLVQLAEAMPQDKMTWRPGAGVRSTSEVFMHIVNVNYFLLDAAGVKTPPEWKDTMVKSVTSKDDVVRWLKRSMEDVRKAHTSASAADLQKKVHVIDRDVAVDGIYLRLLVHANEHMGQLIAYSRVNGIVPPWSK